MGDGTGIQWTDATWNPLRARHRTNGSEGWACVRVSEGCKNCYASTLNESQRWGRGTGLAYTVPNLAKVEHYLDDATLTQPLRWKKPRRVFVCSMTDLFGEWVTDEQLDRIFAVMALTPQHTYQVLTKRPERMREYLLNARERVAQGCGSRLHGGHEGFPKSWESSWPLRNVWLGVSVEDQQRADERIPVLLDTPAAVRFLSCEPLLGPLEFSDVTRRSDAVQQLGKPALAGISWVIVGGESGPNARPFEVRWARSLVQQCRSAEVAVFVKQLGSKPVEQWRQPRTTVETIQGPRRIKLRHPHGGNPEEWPEDLRVREFPTTTAVPA